ncbi:MAG: HNH endonuclease [Sulfitobacter sp.]
MAERHYLAKFNSPSLPGVTPLDWFGETLIIEKPGPRTIPKSLTGPEAGVITRQGVPQIRSGDSLWLCTDNDGPGICAMAEVLSVDARAKQVAVKLGHLDILPTAIALSAFARLQSGSRVFGQLQRSRGPDLYFLNTTDFAEFKQVIVDRYGQASLPESPDWESIIARNTGGAAKGAETDLAGTLRDPRPGQRKFREDLRKIYGQCLVTGCAIPEALDAAHILPWTGDRDLDRYENGLLLRRDIHALFDSALLLIHPETSVIELAASLRQTEYAQYEGREIAHRAVPRLLAERYALRAGGSG